MTPDCPQVDPRLTLSISHLRTGLAIVAKVAHVVQWVHEKELVHRNLSAANVLVARDGSARLIGFSRVAPLAGSDLAAGAGKPAHLDVCGLQDLLRWLCGALRQPVPAQLESVTAPDSVPTAGAFGEALTAFLRGGAA